MFYNHLNIFLHIARKPKQVKKSKTALRQETRERRLKERLRQQELLLENDKDDTSSTTTESSSADPDEKVTTKL